MSDQHVPALRRRFLEDMRIKVLQPKTQTMYLRAMRDFTRFGAHTGEIETRGVGDFSSAQDLLNAYEKLGLDILGIVKPDEILKTGLPVVMPGPEGGGAQATTLRSLQPELQEAVLRLLGTERVPE